jgi:hypothetical protein
MEAHGIAAGPQLGKSTPSTPTIIVMASVIRKKDK